MDLDAKGGVRRAWRAWRPASGPPDAVLVATDSNGLANARRIRQTLERVGAPRALFVAPDPSVCASPGTWPCGYSTRFSFTKERFCRILRLRQFLMARFFLAGANVLQLDSDLTFYANPFATFHGTLANVSVVAQSDSPLANSGFFYVRHVSPAADAVAAYLLVEMSNRMVWASRDASGGAMRQDCANDQAQLNDLLIELATGTPRYGLGIVLPELRARAPHPRHRRSSGRAPAPCSHAPRPSV